MDFKERLPSKKKEIDLQNIIEFWSKNIIEDMQWFPIQGIMVHKSDDIKIPAEHLQSLLKVLSMFKIRIGMMRALVAKMFQMILE